MSRMNQLLKLAGACLLAFGLISMAPASADAQNKDKDKKPKSKSYDFSGDDIDGDLIKPDGDFVDSRGFADRTNTQSGIQSAVALWQHRTGQNPLAAFHWQ